MHLIILLANTAFGLLVIILPRVLMKYKPKLNLHCNIYTEEPKNPAEKSVTIDYYLSSH